MNFWEGKKIGVSEFVLASGKTCRGTISRRDSAHATAEKVGAQSAALLHHRRFSLTFFIKIFFIILDETIPKKYFLNNLHVNHDVIVKNVADLHVYVHGTCHFSAKIYFELNFSSNSLNIKFKSYKKTQLRKFITFMSKKTSIFHKIIINI